MIFPPSYATGKKTKKAILRKTHRRTSCFSKGHSRGDMEQNQTVFHRKVNSMQALLPPCQGPGFPEQQQHQQQEYPRNPSPLHEAGV
ncbi:hypothetical protein AALO_G00224510 [Alosa alosa]|uniref:Uncharacterized protein n=1 Tax=Alosa alosa TaxID=278164 RepID=A0AAV6G4X6_9TELE|nr:hypothetical protein AALO_G00224510 [Alosa alosa]